MNETRIPAYAMNRWKEAATKEQKDAFIRQYKSFLSNPFTKDLIAYLEEELQEEVSRLDKELSFISLFQLRFKEQLSRAKRLIYSDLIRKI